MLGNFPGKTNVRVHSSVADGKGRNICWMSSFIPQKVWYPAAKSATRDYRTPIIIPQNLPGTERVSTPSLLLLPSSGRASARLPTSVVPLIQMHPQGTGGRKCNRRGMMMRMRAWAPRRSDVVFRVSLRWRRSHRLPFLSAFTRLKSLIRCGKVWGVFLLGVRRLWEGPTCKPTDKNNAVVASSPVLKGSIYWFNPFILLLLVISEDKRRNVQLICLWSSKIKIHTSLFACVGLSQQGSQDGLLPSSTFQPGQPRALVENCKREASKWYSG